MEILVEQGASRGDCCHKITQKYGIYFNILREKTIPSKWFGIVPEKVEVEFCLSPPSQQYNANRLAAASSVVIPSSAPTALTAGPTALPKDDSTLDFVEAKKRLLKAAGKDPDQIFQQMQQEQEETELNQRLILDTLQEIQKKIETGRERQPDHPSLARIAQMLRQNDFSESYTAGILEKIRKELPLDVLEDFNAVQDRVVGWIGESIKIFDVQMKPGRIMVLVGPTGVGKTTTVAKLAANYGLESLTPNPLSVRIITIDAFRIGAQEQIEKYSSIMNVPLSCPDNRQDLHREIDLYREETDLILVDTIGRSPKDSANLGEMKELLDACGPKTEVHLVISASAKTSDIQHILRQFEPFDYQAVMLTKIDETRHIGNVISALAEKGKAISFITNGQTVPYDIHRANVVRFLINLEEFRIDREKIEKQFPSGEAEQF